MFNYLGCFCTCSFETSVILRKPDSLQKKTVTCVYLLGSAVKNHQNC